MDADTAQERCKIILAPRNQAHDHKQGFIRIKHLAWSSHGDMLAIGFQVVDSLPMSNDGSDTQAAVIACEVHIYNSTTGQCRQSAQFPSSQVTSVDVSWSNSMNILAVLSQPNGVLTVLDADSPAATAQTISQFPSAVSYLWTPCGTLLILNSRQQSFHILNPRPLEEIFHAPQPVFEIPGISGYPGPSRRFLAQRIRKSQPTYGDHGPSSHASSLLATGMPGKTSCRTHGGWFGGCIAPHGDALIVLQPQGDTTANVVHVDLRAQEITQIGPAYAAFQHPGLPCTSGSHIKPTWAPFPRAWPPFYACVYMPPDGDPSWTWQQACPRSVKLVDAKAHAIVGSWTVRELNRLAHEGDSKAGSASARVRDQVLRHVEWAHHGKHLAVCSWECAWILTFGSP